MCYIVVTFVVMILLPLLSRLLRHKSGKPKLPPGPWPLPIIGNLHMMIGSLPHRSLEKLAQRYGPIMSIKMGLVQGIVVSSPEAAQLFLKQHDITFASRPVTQVTKHLFYGSKDVAFAPYGDYWRRVRKMCTLHLLTVTKVESFEGLRRTGIKTMVGKLKQVSESGEIVELGEVVKNFIHEIVFKMILGTSKGHDKKYDLKFVSEEILEIASAFNFADFLPFLASFNFQGLTKRMKQLSIVIDKILDEIIYDHLKEENLEHQNDILSSILRLMNNPSDEWISSSFDRDSVKAIILDLLGAGIDSTWYAIMWALALLLKEPRVMKLLQNELNAIVGKSKMIEESDLCKFPYLDMVVKETLRLYPVGPLLVPRESREDIIINGHMIPNKARIIINFWAIARDCKVWGHDANEFHPERFMNEDIDVQGQNYKYFPFGSGRRGCPGMQLSMVMIKIVIAQMVHCFDLNLPFGMKPEDVDMTEKLGLAMGRVNKLYAVPSFSLHVQTVV